MYKQTYKRLRSIWKPVEPCLAALTHRGQQRGPSRPVCRPRLGLTGAAPGKAVLCLLCGVNVNEVWRRFWEEQMEGVLGQQCFLVLLTHTPGALLLHLIRCEGHAPSLCMVLSSSSRAEACPSAGTLSPQSQPISGRPMVAAAPTLSSRTGSFPRSFFCGEVVLSQSTLYRAEKAQSLNAFFLGNPFTEKTVLRVQGRLWCMTG